MVEIADLSIVFTGAAVTVAAIYYIFNMRYAMKVREMETAKFITQFFTTETTMKSFGIVLHQMECKDWKEFKQKYYDSDPEMYAKINSCFWLYEVVGYMVRNKLVKPETAYELGGFGGLQLWDRYSGFIHWRRGNHPAGRSLYRNWEFLAQEMKKINDKRK